MKFDCNCKLLRCGRRPPHGGRGLKCYSIRAIKNETGVAPRTGGVD